MKKLHSFHIPVMGTGFSIDTPIKVAKYGISSVISLVDDFLIEEIRRIYSEKYGEPYSPITRDQEDYRARRITAYLDLVDKIVSIEFEKLRNSPFEPESEITKYFELLPETSPLKGLYQTMLKTETPQMRTQLQNHLRELIEPGDINVNIMTKLDRPYFDQDGRPKSPEFSDAMSALRGFAKSRIKAAIEFSAGLNQRLYTYASEFKDFYLDSSGQFKKRIILKVSDFRSAIVQGKIFAKKGLWVSEFRIESGLNCGGHAFATQGHLMGPILEEFRTKRQEMVASLLELYNQAVKIKNKLPFARPPQVTVTVQGGIGTSSEDQFLKNQYAVDMTGWATPFLLCPEVTNVDPITLEKLRLAEEKDLYLSDVSPLGVPFNNLRGNLSDEEKERLIKSGTPGRVCQRGHLMLNTEFGDHPLCPASRVYQQMKLRELAEKKLSPEEHEREYQSIIAKTCICHDLGESVFMKIGNTSEKHTPAVCPGPNMAYFNRIASLKEMVDHIYGRTNLLAERYRPHVFVQELKVYVDYFKAEVEKAIAKHDSLKQQYWCVFKDNLLQGIDYYRVLFSQKVAGVCDSPQQVLDDLQSLGMQLQDFVTQHASFFAAVSGKS